MIKKKEDRHMRVPKPRRKEFDTRAYGDMSREDVTAGNRFDA